MSKKKKKNRIKREYEYLNNIKEKDKKSINKEFKRALKDIEKMQISLYEIDKKYDRKNRRKINKNEGEVYATIESIKHRKNMAKRWEEKGFLDHMIDLLREVSPFIQLLAKALAGLIITFLSIDGIKKVIKPKTLRKITKVFDIAMSI